MKTALTSLTALFLLTLTVFADGKRGWDDNYEKGLAEAKKDGKMVLLDFTGSDWCGYCMKLDDEVFSKSDFKKFAKDKLVLIELDYPKGKRLNKATQEQNAELKTQFRISGYPTIVMVDAEGKEQARWVGYKKDLLSELEKKVGELKK